MRKINEMGFVRVAAVSPELKVADIDFNKNEIWRQISLANEKQCQIILFPELAITSYSCADLFYQSYLLEGSLKAIEEIALQNENAGSIVILGAPLFLDNMLFNCAFVLADGEIKGIVPKTYLPNRAEFYEKRWFSSEFQRTRNDILISNKSIPFGADLLFSFSNLPNCKFGIEIGDDFLAVEPPSSQLALTGANLLFNISASPEILNKAKLRKLLVQSHSARTCSAYIYSSAGAGESSTDNCFSGAVLIAENGELLNDGERFSFDSQMEIADIDFEMLNKERMKNSSFFDSPKQKNFRDISFEIKYPNPPLSKKKEFFREISPAPFISKEAEIDDFCKEILNIQTTALAKRIKHTQLKNIVLGASGGLDSTYALIIALKSLEKLGLSKKHLIAVTMPGMGTSKLTKNNIVKLAELLEINLLEIPIEKAVKQHFEDIGHNPELKNVVYENAQARERTQILMDLANKHNGFVLGTGDLSELALGWCTFNADHISMYAINSGVPKTMMKRALDWIAKKDFKGETTNVLLDILKTPISPELLPITNDEMPQKTEELIGDYILNDFFLFYFLRFGFSPEKILFLSELAFQDAYSSDENKYWLNQFYRRFFAHQFKRSCMPDGVKVCSVSLSPRADWKMPSDASPFNC